MRPVHANLLLVLCAAIWGLSFLFQKTAMEHVPPFQFVAARCALAAVALVPFALIEHRSSGPIALRGLTRMMGIAGGVFLVAAYLQQVGIISATVTNSAFLTALYVVITPLLVWGLMGQRPQSMMWAAVALSAGGAWLLGGGGPLAFGKGEFAVLLATVFWALHVVVLGVSAPLGRPIALTAGQFAVAAVLATACALAFERIDVNGLQRAGLEIAYVGILSGALTFSIFTVALRSTSASAATVIASTEAPFAAVGAYVMLGERLTLTGMIGAAMMVAAALAANASVTRGKVKPLPP
jgi:drug/metabolite transporter (DMT)-like permease